MSEKLHEYRGKALNVTWDATRCIHSAACIRSLPRAFDPGSRPWVMPDNGAPDAVVRAVEACPTGALKYQRHDGGPEEVPPAENAAAVTRNGPVHLRGDISLLSPDAGPLAETRMALCRCGASAHKPLCDGSHTKVRFSDPGTIPANAAVRPDGPAGGQLAVTPLPDGPVQIEGAFRLVDSSGTTAGVMDKATLCRCGRSGNKPFCDGSHRTS